MCHSGSCFQSFTMNDFRSFSDRGKGSIHRLIILNGEKWRTVGTERRECGTVSLHIWVHHLPESWTRSHRINLLALLPWASHWLLNQSFPICKWWVRTTWSASSFQFYNPIHCFHLLHPPMDMVTNVNDKSQFLLSLILARKQKILMKFCVWAHNPQKSLQEVKWGKAN